jgi:radical SAM protein with 4Fe4S-binding SPASM domain
MLYRQKYDVFIRHFGDIGYIVNQAMLSDRVVNASGAVFLDAISREAKDIDSIVSEIASKFYDPPDGLKEDIISFYKILEDDGFLISGQTIEELDEKDKHFSYQLKGRKTDKRDFTPAILRNSQDSQEYLTEHFKETPQLLSLQMEITSQCNERCVHCYIPHEKKTDVMSMQLYKSVIDQASEMGLLLLTLSGGEPMSHEHFIEMLQYAKTKDFSVSILSNLTLLTDEIIEILKTMHISVIKVSLYSLDPEIHDSITQLPGSQKKTLSAIERLIEADIPVQINCPVMKENKNSLDSVIKWAAAHKIRAISDYIMMARYDHTTDNLEHRLGLNDVERLIQNVIEGDSEYRKHIETTDIDEVLTKDISDEPICGVCISSICMVSNGNMYPCAGWQDRVLGNVAEQSLKEIWLYSKEVNYLRSIRKKHFPQCLSCEDRAFCAMCMVRNANESPTGDPTELNKHFCKVAAINHELVCKWRESHGQ